MKKVIIIFLVITSLTLILVGCGSSGPTYTISGKVLIHGAVPGKVINVTYNVNYGPDKSILTDTAGNYSFSSGLKNGDNIWIHVNSYANYTTSEVTSKQLNDWTGINPFTVNSAKMVVPTIDLYSFGFSFTSPADSANVTSFASPVSIVFNPYVAPGVTVHHYSLYFYDNNNNYLGWSSDFTDCPWDFNGTISHGSNPVTTSTLAQNAQWYLRCTYIKNGYYMYATLANHSITYGDGSKSISVKSMPNHEDVNK